MYRLNTLKHSINTQLSCLVKPGLEIYSKNAVSTSFKNSNFTIFQVICTSATAGFTGLGPQHVGRVIIRSDFKLEIIFEFLNPNYTGQSTILILCKTEKLACLTSFCAIYFLLAFLIYHQFF